MESKADHGGGSVVAGEDAHIRDGDQDTDVDGEALPLSPIARQYSPSPPHLPRRIHILGTGSIGKLVAHSLRGTANPPPITLILHRYKLLQAWQQSKKQITIQDDGFNVSRGGFDVELQQEIRKQHGVKLAEGGPEVYDIEGVRPHEAAEIMEQQEEEHEAAREPTHWHGHSPGGRKTERPRAPSYHARPERNLGAYAVSHEPIHNLIVTTKAPLTVSALSSIRHRLLPTSTICFLQNGMGVIDDVNEKLFPDEAARPNYVQGIITHGVNVPPEMAERDPFFAVHAGHGTIALGLMPRSVAADTETDSSKPGIPSTAWAPSARYVMRTLTRTPALCAVGFAPTELLQQQLEKLAVNSILNPLTSLIDARNGHVLYNFALTRTMRLMLAETSLVIRSLPELQGIPNVQARFSAERLETLVVSVAHRTRDNVSSMLADVRSGRRTEIEYINGYIVKRGEQLGIKCVVNYAIMQTVMGKAMMTRREMQDAVPVANDLNREG